MDLVVSFVVDGAAPYPFEAYLLARSLIETGGVPADRIVAHLVRGCDAEVERALARLGVTTRWVEPFGHPWCNKLMQLATLQGERADRFLLLDTDMLCVAPLRLPESRAILGKRVDHAVPPMDVLQGVFAAAGLPWTESTADVDGDATVSTNLNGGLYVVPATHLPTLAEAWVRWAHWCLAGVERFGSWSRHIDQVAFALAVTERALPVEDLPRAWNVPTHLGPVAIDGPPRFLHHHRRVDERWHPSPTGTPAIDTAIAALAPAIDRWRSGHPVGALFRAARAAVHPEIADEVLLTTGADLARRSVVGRVTTLLGARTTRDVVGPDDRDPDAAVDLALCLGLLPQMADVERYRRTVAAAVTAGRLGCLVSGLDAPPVDAAGGTTFHEPLLDSLLAIAGIVPLPVASDGPSTIYLVLPDGPGTNARDATPATLRRAVTTGRADPLLLAACIVTSRRELGFFPDHAPRAIEYPWVLERLRRTGLRGGHVADVGAGVSVLPLLVHDAGHLVTTIDPHPIDRDPSALPAMEEWGFLDYAALRDGIRSERVAYEAYGTAARYDVIMSVSVVEHLRAEVRRAWWERMAAQLRPGGTLLLTVDLTPFSRHLWGWSEGVLVEPPTVHGTLDDLLAELVSAGFAVDELEVISWMPGSRVGTALVSATRALGSLDPPTRRPRDRRPVTGTASAGRHPDDAVTVLIPAYRPTERLTAVLASLAAQDHPHLTVRVSVDHAPGHGLPPIPDMGHVELELLHQPDRRGWVGNMNRLFDTLTTPYFVILPHDDILSPAYIEKAVAVLRADRGVVSAHGGLRYHGVRDGEVTTTPSIRGDRRERLTTFFDRGPQHAGLLQRGVIRSSPIWDGVRFRTHRSDGQFTNDLCALELLLYGSSVAIDGLWYDKYTDPGGLSRVFHARTTDQKSAMLADNLACLLDVLDAHRIEGEEAEWLLTRYATWLLGVQGNWNVVDGSNDSDRRPYGEVRPALARFIARALLSTR